MPTVIIIDEAEEIPASVLEWLRTAPPPKLAPSAEERFLRPVDPPSDNRRSVGDTCPVCCCGILRPWGETRIACENCDHMEQA